MTMQTTTAPIAQVKNDNSLFDRIWPPAAIIVGLGLTAAWTSFLGYGIVDLILSAFQ
jgi:hypothetical protein